MMGTEDWEDLFREDSDVFPIMETTFTLPMEECLALAAEEENEEEFDRLLEEAGEISIWKENMFAGSRKGNRKKPPAMLITEKSRYLHKIFRRYGPQNETFESRRCYIKRSVVTDAPGIYRAILAGSADLVKLYLEYGTVLEKDSTMSCLMQKADFRNNRNLCDRGLWEIPVQYRRETGYTVNYFNQRIPKEMETGEYAVMLYCGTSFSEEVSLSFHDPLTAAIWSQSKDMIRLIADTFPEIEWNGCMEQSVVCSGLEITAWLIENFPELMQYISLRKIVEGKNVVLLRHFLKERSDGLSRQWEEVKEYLHWYTEESYAVQKKQCYWKRLRTGEEIQFYRKLLSCAPDKECVELLLRMVFLEWVQAEWDGGRGRKGLWKLFCSRQKDGQQDYLKLLSHFSDRWGTPDGYLYGGIGVEECMQCLKAVSGEKEYRRLGVDLYDRETESWAADYENYRRSGTQFMKIFVPLGIEHQTDWFTRGVIRSGDVRLVRSAVKRGFITEKNADCLYLYAAEQENPREEILEILVGLSQKRDLKERYQKWE